MSNALYPLWKQALMRESDLNKSLDQGDAVNGAYVALVSSAYVYSPSHQFYTALTGIIGTPQQITSPSVVGSVFSGNGVVFTNITGTINAIVIYRPNAGANSTWRLVAYEDTGIAGLPLTVSGGNVTLSWNPSGIFALGAP